MAKRRPSGDGMVRKRDDGRWLDEYAAPRLRESTMSGYRIYAEQYINPCLGNKKMNSITPADIQRLYTKLKKEGRVREHPEYGRALSAGTVRRIYTMLHRALGDAVKTHIIPRNPAEGLTLPKADCSAKRVPTDRELEKFMETIKADLFWHDFFYTELTTGLRRGEICGLQWRDFDLETGMLQVCRTLHKMSGGGFETGETKTGKGKRKILLPQSTADMLRARWEIFPGKWIFPNPFKLEQPVAPDMAYRRFKSMLREAGITESIPFHALRHPNVKPETKRFSTFLKFFKAALYAPTWGVFLFLQSFHRASCQGLNLPLHNLPYGR